MAFCDFGASEPLQDMLSGWSVHLNTKLRCRRTCFPDCKLMAWTAASECPNICCRRKLLSPRSRSALFARSACFVQVAWASQSRLITPTWEELESSKASINVQILAHRASQLIRCDIVHGQIKQQQCEKLQQERNALEAECPLPVVSCNCWQAG